MFRFLTFSFLLFVVFPLEQSVLLPFGLSPGGFFMPFLVWCACVFFLEREWRWWFLALGGIITGLFSVMPLFSFLLFAFGGALFFVVKRLAPVEGAFSFPAALWFGVVSYFFAFFLLWGGAWIFGLSGAITASFFGLFSAPAAFFVLEVLIPATVVWWLVAHRRRDKQLYMLQ